MGRSGIAGTSSLLLLLALAAVGGFLFWLYTQAQSLEENVEPVMDDTTGVTAPSLESLATDPSSAIGQESILDTVVVADRLGRAVFSLRLDDTLSYPVLLEAEMIQRGLTVYGGDRITVGGRFYALSDSIREEWLARGAVDSASYDGLPDVPSFLLADSVDILEQ